MLPPPLPRWRCWHMYRQMEELNEGVGRNTAAVMCAVGAQLAPCSEGCYGLAKGLWGRLDCSDSLVKATGIIYFMCMAVKNNVPRSLLYRKGQACAHKGACLQ